jgi:hypothetical protein
LKQLLIPERQRKHLSLNHALLRHLRNEQDRLLIYSLERGVRGPKLVFVTATFLPLEEMKADALPIPPSACFKVFEQLYTRMLSEVMNHYERPGVHHLQPLAFAFIDFPWTKRKKDRTASDFERLLQRLGREHPQTTPHIHALMLIHPDIVERFEHKQSSFESLFKSLRTINRTLEVRELIQPGDDERVLRYSSELLKKPPHPDLKEADLFMWLPKARSEPTYQKLPYERELEQALAEDRLFRRRHVRGVL